MSRAEQSKEKHRDTPLVYGPLLEVASATLRERYNRAMEILCGRRTVLEAFHIDQTGFSPEVAEELDDPHYLNPNGCNRKLIFLTIEQAELPLVDGAFSSSRAIVRRFIEDNRDALFALTTRDVVYGELENSVYRVDTLDDVISIKNIRVEVNTPQGLISKARQLAEKVAAFEADDDAWTDDAVLGEMIALAETTGDIRRHPLVPRRLDYAQGNFFTTHLGGLYVLNAASSPTLISCDPDFAVDERFGWIYHDGPDSLQHIALADSDRLAGFLDSEKLVRPLAGRPAAKALAPLKRTLDFIVIDHAARHDALAPGEAPPAEDMKRLIYEHLDALPELFHQLAQVVRALEQDEPPPAFEPTDPAYFYLLRPAAPRDKALVEHLIAGLAPLDARRLFLCNKEVFCNLYPEWPEAKRAYVAAYLARHGLTGRQPGETGREGD